MQYTVTHSKAAGVAANRVKRQLVFLSLVFVRMGHPVSQLREEQFEVITNATASKKANEEDKQPDLASTPCRLRLLEEFIVLFASAMCKKGHKKIHPYFCIASEPNIMQCAPHAHTVVPLTAMRQSQLPLRDWSWQEDQRLLPKQTQSRHSLLAYFTVSSVMRKDREKMGAPFMMAN